MENNNKEELNISSNKTEQIKTAENQEHKEDVEVLAEEISAKEEALAEREAVNLAMEDNLVKSLAEQAMRESLAKESAALDETEKSKTGWFKGFADNLKNVFKKPESQETGEDAGLEDMNKAIKSEMESGEDADVLETGLEDKSWFKKALESTNKAIDFDFDSLNKLVETKGDDSNMEKAARWAGKAALAIPKIVLAPVKFCKDAAMATAHSIDNNRQLNKLQETLDGKSPEKLLDAMKLDKNSAEYKTISETLNSSDPETKKLALDAVAKRLSREGQAQLNSKTKIGNYLTLGEKINGEDAKKEEAKTEIGVWNFTEGKSSLADKKAIATQSFKNGMLMHLLKDPTEIATLLTCTINGEYVSNLGKFNVKNVLESKNTSANLAKDLEMIKNLKNYSPEMQAKIKQSFSLSDKEDRMDTLKKSTAAGSYTATNYLTKQAKTVAYLGLRKTVGLAVDAYKFSVDKHKESILASEVANSGITEDYAKLMLKLNKKESQTPQEEEKAKAELATESGYKLLHLSEGGANILLDQTINKLIKNKDKKPEDLDEEINFLKKYSDFAKYQTDKGRMDVTKLDQINGLIAQYKMETMKAAPEKLEILDKEGYDSSSFACKKTGKIWRDMLVSDKNHSKFLGKNKGNLMAAYIGYQADRLASLGFQGGGLGELGAGLGMDALNFGGGIAVEHIALENIQHAIDMVPDNVISDVYQATKDITSGAGKIMSSDTVFKIAGGVLSSEAKAAEVGDKIKEKTVEHQEKTGVEKTEAFKKINNFAPNKFDFTSDQEKENLAQAKDFVDKNASYIKNSLKNIVIKSGCDERNASPELQAIDKAIAAKNKEAIVDGLKALKVTSEADINKFLELSNKNVPGEKLTGNYSLHVLRSMTMLKETIASIEKSNLSKGQKEKAIRNIKVEILKGGVVDTKDYEAARYNQLEIEAKSEWTIGKDESVEILIDNSPSGEEKISANAAFFRDYVDMNKDRVVGEATITATRFAGGEKEVDPSDSGSRENNYKTFLKINKDNIGQLDATKEVEKNINGKGSAHERMLRNTILKLNEIKTAGKKVDKIFVVSDEGFQKDLTIANLRVIEKMKQETGVKEVYFVILNKEGVPNKIEAGKILADLSKLNNMGEDKAKEFLFTKSAYKTEDGEVVKYSDEIGDELLDKSKF